jgi:1,4-dihydroxy-2-naphthoyl-CoA hydrolase
LTSRIDRENKQLRKVQKLSRVDRYDYTVRLADTDAARVVYFANMLRICHEAYEHSLAQAGIDLGMFLGDSEMAIPIVNCRARFLLPVYCGDRLSIFVNPESIGETEFRLDYEIKPTMGEGKILAIASTSHVCIDIKSRSRRNLPDSIRRWLEGK